MTIGRRADNDICLPFPAVTGEHAAVVTILDDSFLEDLGSPNGTLVNGKAITKHFLRDHDEIDIGRHTLVYFSGELRCRRRRRSPTGPNRSRDENGGATIGDDEATVVSSAQPQARLRRGCRRRTARLRRRARFRSGHSPQPASQHGVRCRRATIRPPMRRRSRCSMGQRRACRGRIEGEEFVLGRLGVQIAAIRSTPEGLRLCTLEGETPPRVNGARLPPKGRCSPPGTRSRSPAPGCSIARRCKRQPTVGVHASVRK